ncbi:hypothetical protein B0H21DRAFT_723340 [Amylocystis lapponica]|nr:hypothetical protein B0H21DRAFT_723340 [Amylocystis lapponica]
MTLYSYIQRSLFVAISHPQFNAALPPYPTRPGLNERLEFLGDALMYATIGRQLYAQIPDGTPHLYTVQVRNALHSNATFSYLAEKLDILAVSGTVLRALTIRTFGEVRPQVKATADLFETVIGAYYLEVGFEPLCDWVREIYTPLIKVAENSFLKWQANRKQRLRSGVFAGRITKKPRLMHSPFKSTRRSAYLTNYAREQICTDVTPHSNVQWSAKPTGSGMTLRSSLCGTASQPPVHALPAKPAAAPVVIDLTFESDDSDDEDDDIIIIEPPHTSTIDQQPRVAVPWSRKSPAVALMCRTPRVGTGVDDEDSSREDEAMLEKMLTTDIFSGVGADLDDMAGNGASARGRHLLVASGSQVPFAGRRSPLEEGQWDPKFLT